ncbi:hypothetical protein DXG01_008732 [Tephrocybe rancida]|nr:hypothetical protein DXG01_008732 [Tephrocybe rancida]
MFVASSRGRSDSYSQDPYSGAEYGGAVRASGGTFPSSNDRYSSNDPYSLSSFNFEGQDPLYNHQLSAERHGAEASSSSAVPRSASHGHGKLTADTPRDLQITKQNMTPGAIDYAPRRDLDALDTYDAQLFSGEGVSEQESLHKPRSRSEHSGDTSEPSPVPQKRKPRREKPRIDLAPDQPPTTQGKPRARVYVACVQWPAGGIQCNYDPIPKRRGPDKTPGARQRVSKDSKEEEGDVGPVRRRRRRDTTTQRTATPEAPAEPRHRSRSGSDSLSAPTSIPIPSPVETELLRTPIDFTPLYSDARAHEVVFTGSNLLLDDLAVTSLFDKSPPVFDNTFDLSAIIPLDQFSQPIDTSHAFITSLDESNSEEEEYSGVSCEPSLNFTRKIWWESLLSLYISPDSSHRQNLTAAQRTSAAQGITSDIRFLFSTSNYWFSFFHIPSFNANYLDPARRERLQPCLVLALLAMSTFWQSSEVGRGHLGRERALRFRDEAQSALDASFNAGWIDETLAQAAWLLALFEVCAHPLHSSERSNSSMVMLDSIIRSLSLTFVDADDPKTTTFSPGAVPSVLDPSRKNWLFSDDDFNPHMPSTSAKVVREPVSEPGCACRSMTLITHWQESSEQTPLWTLTPAWNNTWNEAEIRKESCRRLCWSSIILAAGHVSYTTAHRSGILNLFISDPSNYALLFSGESIAYSPALSSSHSSKDTIWALHDRSFLLWHGCTRMRNDTRATDDVKAHFAVKTWLEADALEAALNKHTCRIERQFIFQAREYIFNNVSGLFHRSKAEEWCMV